MFGIKKETERQQQSKTTIHVRIFFLCWVCEFIGFSPQRSHRFHFDLYRIHNLNEFTSSAMQNAKTYLNLHTIILWTCGRNQ